MDEGALSQKSASEKSKSKTITICPSTSVKLEQPLLDQHQSITSDDYLSHIEYECESHQNMAK